MMTQDEMQAAVDALAVDMAAKGFRMAGANIVVCSNAKTSVSLCWAPRGDTWASECKFFDIDNLRYQIIAARTWIYDQCIPDNSATRKFHAELGALIALGRENGIAVDFLNPLTAMAKALSENAITDQRVTK